MAQGTLDKITQLLSEIQAGDHYALAKGITLVENELTGSKELLLQLKDTRTARVVGITGAPGAGKSTLVNALLHHWTKNKKKIAVIAVDPSSPFNYGAVLGDRIRMSDFYTNPNVYIRSIATRGALGGLSAKIIEITDVVKNAPFDIILVETVGVGQSEVEIAGLADCTVVAMVPEGGDKIQTMKAGIMEIANVFVVNKADREEAEGMYNNLRIMTHEKANEGNETPVVKTTATEQKGIEELATAIEKILHEQNKMPEKRLHLMAEKCWQLLQAERMKDIDKEQLRNTLAEAIRSPDFNIYQFTRKMGIKN